jgi:hypothetical protein
VPFSYEIAEFFLERASVGLGEQKGGVNGGMIAGVLDCAFLQESQESQES